VKPYEILTAYTYEPTTTSDSTKYLTRQRLSNPYYDVPYHELLKMAGVKKLVNPKVITYPNGKIKVIEGEI